MTTPAWIALGAAIISLTALGVSILTLWKTHFTKFTPVLTVGNCSFRIYPIKNGNERWFIPSFNIPISTTNNGAQLGKVDDLRLKITFPELPIANHYEIFSAKWIVDANKLSKNRFDWIDKAVVEDWMPMIVLARETKTKNIVFESIRWEEPVIQNKMICTLEIKTDSSKTYQQISKWTFRLTAKEWVALAENGTSFSTSTDITQLEKEWIFPKDLHKYTGTKEDIAKGKSKSSPSYLDYEEKE